MELGQELPWPRAITRTNFIYLYYLYCFQNFSDSVSFLYQTFAILLWGFDKKKVKYR